MVTPLQHRVYGFIEAYLQENPFSPSLSEIATGIGISPKSISLISRSIHSLVEAGKLRFYKKGYRNLQLADAAQLALPVDHFLWQIQGDDLAQKGLLEGDFLILKAPETAEEGSRIFAIIDQQQPFLGTLSYFVPGRYTLVSENSDIKPKAYLPERVQILGVYAGVLPGPGRHGEISQVAL